MMGGMFAGHDECSDPTKYYGMSSDYALDKYAGGKKKYRASEGVSEIKVEPKGPVVHTINEILGGLRSTLTYTGHKELETFVGKAKFIEV